MAALTHFLSLTPKTLCFNQSNSIASAASASTLFTPSSLKTLPKLFLALSSINNRGKSTSRFIRNVAFSSDLEDETLDFSGREELSLSADPKVFVGNLPFSVDSAALAGLLGQAGSIESVEVIFDKATGRSRGFAFVTMSSAKEAEAVAQQFNGYEFQGRALRVSSGPPPPKRENSFGGSRGQDRNNVDNTNKLYVGNLSWDVDSVALETLFSEHGNVKEARVVYDRQNGRSRGFGFVTYTSLDEVNNAIKELDGADLDGRTIRVSTAGAPRQY